MVNFLLDAGCTPTVIIYERQILTEAVKPKDVKARRSMLTEDQIQLLCTVACGIDEENDKLRRLAKQARKEAQFEDILLAEEGGPRKK